MMDRTLNMSLSSMHVLVGIQCRIFKNFDVVTMFVQRPKCNVPTCDEIKTLLEFPRYLLVIIADQCKCLYFT